MSSTGMSWWDTLVADAEAAFGNLGADVQAAIPVIEQDFGEFFSAIVQIALGAVLKQLPLVASGTEKFGAAVTSVVQQVEAKGKKVGLQDAQMAVQSAYNALKMAKAG